MPLTSGTKLGPYEIQSALGAGGMGEVYRARDTRLDRTVAIKILPTHLSSNAEARTRFEREARSISSLNHPNICTLHDVGTQDSTSYLVMEYVEGETLQSQLQKGPLALKQALECAMQVCDALEKAHRAGIVHRDLKPGNIMLTASGAKLLDFGLAKPVAVLGAQATDKANLTPSTPTVNLSALSASPAALTQHGTVVGTFQYLAPEVLQGHEADPRSDIFSFGCVLYEMLTARRAFEGKSQLSVMTAILEKDPEPIAATQPTAPPALDYVVQTCLEKNPDTRFQTAHDVKLQLAWIAKSGSQAGVPALALGHRPRPLWAIAVAILSLLVIGLASALFFEKEPRRILRTNLLPPEGTQFETMYRNGPIALSPDGTRIVFVARQEGKNSLWLRSLDKLEATLLRGTDEAFFPFWSPDGSAIAFFMQGKLWRMDLPNGSPVALSEAREARGGSWGSQNIIVFAPSISGPIARVAASGGSLVNITKTPPASPTISDRWPIFLPDGKHFLFLHALQGDADVQNEIRLSSIDGGDEETLLRGRLYSFQYAAGWLLTDRDGSLQAWKFDPGRGKLSTNSFQLVDKIASDDITAASVFSVSAQGSLLYQEGSGETGDRHVWLDSSGKQISRVSEPGVYGPTRLSPDETHIATPMLEQTGETRLWVWNVSGGARARVSASGAVADASVWSADGRTLFFSSSDVNHAQVRQVPADGSQPEQVLINAETDTVPTDCSADGKWLLYEETKKDVPSDAQLKAFPLVKGAETITVLDSVARPSNARLKPPASDWLAYQSNLSGRSEIYLTQFPHPGAKYQVSQGGGSQPVWSKDGKRLYYLDRTQRITVVDVQTDHSSPQIGAARVLFQSSVRQSIPTAAYDVTRDGRFLMVSSIVESTAPVVLVTNWDAELRK